MATAAAGADADAVPPPPTSNGVGACAAPGAGVRSGAGGGAGGSAHTLLEVAEAAVAAARLALKNAATAYEGELRRAAGLRKRKAEARHNLGEKPRDHLTKGLLAELKTRRQAWLDAKDKLRSQQQATAANVAAAQQGDTRVYSILRYLAQERIGQPAIGRAIANGREEEMVGILGNVLAENVKDKASDTTYLDRIFCCPNPAERIGLLNGVLADSAIATKRPSQDNTVSASNAVDEGGGVYWEEWDVPRKNLTPAFMKGLRTAADSLYGIVPPMVVRDMETLLGRTDDDSDTNYIVRYVGCWNFGGKAGGEAREQKHNSSARSGAAGRQLYYKVLGPPCRRTTVQCGARTGYDPYMLELLLMGATLAGSGRHCANLALGNYTGGEDRKVWRCLSVMSKTLPVEWTLGMIGCLESFGTQDPYHGAC
jgi:hypothetical protein